MAVGDKTKLIPRVIDEACEALTPLAANTTNAGTAKKVTATSVECRSVHIVAKPANTLAVYIGNASVSSVLYNEILNPGESVDIPIDDPSKVYFDVAVNGEGIQPSYLS